MTRFQVLPGEQESGAAWRLDGWRTVRRSHVLGLPAWPQVRGPQRSLKRIEAFYRARCRWELRPRPGSTSHPLELSSKYPNALRPNSSHTPEMSPGAFPRTPSRVGRRSRLHRVDERRPEGRPAWRACYEAGAWREERRWPPPPWCLTRERRQARTRAANGPEESGRPEYSSHR